MRYFIFLSLFLMGFHISVDAQDDFPFEVHFSLERGLYDAPIQVALTCPGAKIYYTTNGTKPTESKRNLYKKILLLEKNTVIRAFAVKGDERSEPATHTYLINEEPSKFMKASLTIEPRYLFDSVHGLFLEGSLAKDTMWKKTDANFWSRIERKAHIEFFDTERNKTHAQAIGFRIFGGMSRLWPQKSFSITARKHYGNKRIKFKVFGNNAPKKFKNLVFRNSGSDFGRSHFRDALMTEMVRDWDLETQRFRPCHVYINGKYWGIYNIREKINKHFIETHAEVSKDSLDLLEHNAILKTGGLKNYLELLSYMESNAMASPQVYDTLQQWIDIPNIMDYYIAQIYYGNQDAGGNTRYWRPMQNGKWRWILYDTDAGFGLNSHQTNNSFRFFTAPDGPSWPNPPWSTFMLRKLMENPQFKEAFLRRFLTRVYTTFSDGKTTKKLDEFVALYENDIDKHLERWRLAKWIRKNDIKAMYEFGNERTAFLQKYATRFFRFKDYSKIKIDTVVGGEIILDGSIYLKVPLNGKYPTGSTFIVEARPKLGYKFSHWEGTNSKDPKLHFKVRDSSYYLKPVFDPYIHPMQDLVLINEICPYSPASKDWIEIYNNSDNWVDLTNWKLEDAKQHFTFPKMKIQPKSYVLVAQNAAKFRNTYFGLYNLIPGMPFGINKWSERLTLYSDDGSVVDAVAYQQEPLDSAFVRGLLLPDVNNADDENWVINMGLGTPGKANPYFLESTIKVKQDWFLRIGASAAFLLTAGLCWYGFYFLKRRRNKNFDR